MNTPIKRPIFTVKSYFENMRLLGGPLTSIVDAALGLNALTKTYHSVPAESGTYGFSPATLKLLNVALDVDPEELALIPKEGPCIVVANHPHGGLDGLLMMQALAQVRPDFKLIANHFLSNFVELRPLFLEVDPFGTLSAKRFNVAAARAAIKWVEAGHLLMMFPAAEVSSLDLRQRRILDPAWGLGVARIAEKTQAPVTPIFISGRNSALFQIGGLIHPAIRTALLTREMLKHHAASIHIKVGRSITPQTLTSINDRQKVTKFLRTKTYLLKAKEKQQIALGRINATSIPQVPIIDPISKDLLAIDVNALPAPQCLLTSGTLNVYYALADQIPWVLQEIGRLRELSFRAVGEGTGKPSDLDMYDSYYKHLFVWDTVKLEIIGGYRLGESDKIFEAYGAKGLYINSLFKFAPPLAKELRSALEVGRSFVSPDYQRSYSALMLLWKGIAQYILRHPKYRILFGPVSISNDYHPLSQQILVEFLKHQNQETRRASQVKPRQPFTTDLRHLVDLDSVDLRIIEDLLSTVEHDDKGVPVLIRQYLKIGGQILSFNIDPEFNNAIDCLLWVDLLKTELPILRKYFGVEGAEQFLEFHRAKPEIMSAVS